MSKKSPAAPEPLKAAALRWRCDPASFPFDTTADVEKPEGVIGQDIAVEALRFGLETGAPGQNVFVRGLTGTGRSTMVRRLLETIEHDTPPPKDRCYVYNFAQPDRPRLITLPRGEGEPFRRAIDKFIAFIKEGFAEGLASDVVKTRGGDIERRSTEQMKAVAKPFEEELRKADLIMLTIEAGPATRQLIAPLIDGKPATPERVEELRREEKMSDEEYEAMRERIHEFSERMQAVGEKMQEIQLARMEALANLIKQEAKTLLDNALRTVRKGYTGADVGVFVEEVVEDVLEKRLGDLGNGAPFTERYRVNVVLKHAKDEPSPSIVEYLPSVQSLLGTIDRSLDPDEDVFAPQMMIRGGSLLRSDGGFLVVEGMDLLAEPGAWKALIRTLRSGCIELVPPSMPVPWQLPALKPEPIPVSLKIIMIGDTRLYYALDAFDTGFGDYFKVLADFETTLERTPEGVGFYASVLAGMVAREDMPPFDRTAIAALCEHGARIAAQDQKLTARFGRLADLAREAAYLAGREEHTVVNGDNVHEAVARTKKRASLPGRRYSEMITSGVVRVQIAGASVGEVNGLAVMQAGPLTYGFPTRITATIGPGSAGTINIERESNLSGAIHTKGFYILSGLLRHLLRTEHPLTFSASIAFEQSYGGIDGDSASGAEMCCLISALTDVPIRQDFAMTGAIDQVGNILPIGGVNEKIEGFYDVCADGGLTGTQGVIIPRTNVGDLMLRRDVVEACTEGKFRVYSVDRIHEALALFSGMPAGELDAEGAYPEDSLLGLAFDKAGEYWDMVVQAAVPQVVAETDEEAAVEEAVDEDAATEEAAEA